MSVRAVFTPPALLALAARPSRFLLPSRLALAPVGAAGVPVSALPRPFGPRLLEPTFLEPTFLLPIPLRSPAFAPPGRPYLGPRSPGPFPRCSLPPVWPRQVRPWIHRPCRRAGGCCLKST